MVKRSRSTTGATLGFLQWLWALDHALQRRSKWMARSLGLTGPQRFALRLVQQQPGLSAGALAQRLKLDPSTLTGVLARLERRRLIARRVDRADKRRARLHLTAQGRAATTERAGSIEQIVGTVLARTSPRDQIATARILSALVDALERGAFSRPFGAPASDPRGWRAAPARRPR